MVPLIVKDIALGLDDLNKHVGADEAETAKRVARKALLDRSEVASLYLRRLAAKRAEIMALPAALVDDEDLGMALAEADEQFDGSAKGIWHAAEAHRIKPGVDESVRKAAEAIQAGFLPKRSEVNLSYADEASLAKERAPLLETLRPQLDLILVAGGTLLGWAHDYVGAGLTIEALLARRYLLGTGAPDRTPAGRLRSELIGLLGRFRGAIGDEIADGILPPEADAQIFGYFDRLAADRAKLLAARAASRAKPETPAEA